MWLDVVPGYLNFCLGRLAETRQWHQDVAIALHEIMFLGASKKLHSCYMWL